MAKLTLVAAWLACVSALWIQPTSAAVDGVPTTGPDANNLPCLQKKGAATQLIVDGKPFLVLGGELHNSSASSLSYMQPIWPGLVGLNLNTVLATVSWELIEPQEGHFDFTLVDGLIREARAHHLRLIFLWFGSWKNAESSYVPAWVKLDPDRFPHVVRRSGASEVLTPLGINTMNADATAFAALMRHIRQADAEQHTVLMVQVENETGVLRDSRDRSSLAEAAFAKPVPAELITYLTAHKEGLVPLFKKSWESAGFRTEGTWSDLFGDAADETFMAWYFGRYLDAVAAHGKAEYPLPMFVNSWLAQSPNDTLESALQGFAGGRKPGDYPSGGPVSKMMDVWRAAAPHIDILAPDIYLPNFKAIVASYTWSANPLFIPEASPNAAIPRAFYAFGQRGAIGFSPFGIDSLSGDRAMCDGYQVLGSLAPLISANQGSEKIAGVLQDADGDGAQKQSLQMGNYRVNITFESHDKSQPCYGILIGTGPDEFIVAGAGLGITFSQDAAAQATRILSIDEGSFENGQWIPGRRINGDESNHNSRFNVPGGKPSIRRIKLYSVDRGAR